MEHTKGVNMFLTGRQKELLLFIIHWFQQTVDCNRKEVDEIKELIAEDLYNDD